MFLRDEVPLGVAQTAIPQRRGVGGDGSGDGGVVVGMVVGMVVVVVECVVVWW